MSLDNGTYDSPPWPKLQTLNSARTLSPKLSPSSIDMPRSDRAVAEKMRAKRCN